MNLGSMKQVSLQIPPESPQCPVTLEGKFWHLSRATQTSDSGRQSDDAGRKQATQTGRWSERIRRLEPGIRKQIDLPPVP